MSAAALRGVCLNSPQHVDRPLILILASSEIKAQLSSSRDRWWWWFGHSQTAPCYIYMKHFCVHFSQNVVKWIARRSGWVAGVRTRHFDSKVKSSWMYLYSPVFPKLRGVCHRWYSKHQMTVPDDIMKITWNTDIHCIRHLYLAICAGILNECVRDNGLDYRTYY